MKYSQFIGVAAALLLIGACFLPWAYFPSLQKDFTGFFSQDNAYGRPGKIFVILCSMAIVLYLIPRIWAKRTNMFVVAIVLAFAIKCFILYTSCYTGICPEKRIGIFLILLASMIMVAAALTPRIAVKEN
jgi:hypothetical protein